MVNTANEKSSRDWGIIQKKEKDGNTYFYARIIRIDGNGKKKQYVAKADNKSHARRLRDELQDKYSRRGEKAIEGDKVTFRKLAEAYKKHKLKPAEYHGNNGAERKVAGLRSVKPVLHYLGVLKQHFGAYLLRNISHTDIEEFKALRLKTKSKRGERSIADVNRTLALMRTMMRFAVQNGWIHQSPFELGTPLISTSDEVKRERTMSFDEESRFLAACEGEREITYERSGKQIKAKLKGGRELLRALVVVALDTAMRKGELFKLRWKDVDFEQRLITVTAFNSKTSKSRVVGMTQRVTDELVRLWDISLKDPDSSVFGLTDIKKSFSTVSADAGIAGLQFHDLRHTAITRMVNAGLPPMEIMKVSGHSQWTTFARYVNPSSQTVRNIADAMTDYIGKGRVVLESELIN
ncbi:MAG: tyrosine-type recombinase/integrase [Blastocatellia bacterium]|nr:tyrosine-type recombinase/integrase [Blastocatellia bacterium]